MNGIISIVRVRSLLFSICFAAIIAGTLQPKPMSIGMNERPCSPTRCIILSMRKAALDMYPESSSRDRKKKRITMLGRNASTEPTPWMIPSVSMLVNHPGLSRPLHQAQRALTPDSIHPWG